MWLTLLLIIFAVLLTVVYVWFKINFSYWTRYPQIPSVKGSIFSGDFKDFLTFKTNFGFHLKSIYDNEKFKNAAVVGVYGLYKPGLLIREPELIKSVLIKNFNSFKNRTCQAGNYDLIGSLNIFFGDYKQWKELRSKLVSSFSTGKLKNMYPLIQEVGENLDDYLIKQPDCFVAEVQDLCCRYTTNVTATTLFGITANALENPQEIIHRENIELVTFRYKRGLEFTFIFFAPKLNAILRPRVFAKTTEKFVRSSITQIMAEREKSGVTRNDLIDVFLKLKQEAAKTGEDLTQCLENIFSQATIMMMGSYGATSSAIYYSVYELAKQPEIQQKLRADIHEAFAQGNGEISYEALNKLEYLEMVLCETLRMYPNLAFLDRMHAISEDSPERFNLQPFYDFELPNEMPVYVSLSGLHFDEKYWPNPCKFDPERFSAANKTQLNSMAYLPYGTGPHQCLAFSLGKLQAKMALVYFLKNHFVRVCSATTDVEFDPKAFVLHTKGGIHLEIVRDNLSSKKNTFY